MSAGRHAAIASTGSVLPERVVPNSFFESLVDAKSDFRCKFEVNAPPDLAPDIAAVTLQRIDHFLRVAPAKRHDVNGRQSQIGANANLGHRDHVTFDDRIMDLAAR